MAPDALATGSALAILRIIEMCAQGRHDWVVELALLAPIEEFLHRQVPELQDTLLALAEKAWTTAAAYPPPRPSAATVEVGAANATAVADDLGRAGAVVVEDMVSDRLFLDFVVSVLGADDVAVAVERGWIEIVHAGGSGRIVAVATERAGRFTASPARVAAVVDSDRLNPGERTPVHDKAAILARDHGIRTVVLEFREVENYIPNRALAALAPAREVSRRVAALKTLSADQRAYYDVKHGFRDGVVPVAQADLFRDVPPVVVRRLSDGFGKRVIECLTAAGPGLTVADIDALGGGVRRELGAIVDLLRELI